MSRRKRCTGCGGLHPAERLARVGARDALCPDCLLAEAETIAPPGVLGAPVEEIAAQYIEPASEAPEPLPLRSDEERFEGLIERAVEDWPLRKGRLSASALSQFFRCPEQFRRSYVLGEHRPSGGTGLAGTGAHGAIEAALRFKAERGLLATPKQIVDTYDAVFEAAVARAIAREGIVWGHADKVELDYDSALALGRRAVAAYAAEVLPHVEALDVELVFAFDLPGVAVPICGLIDVAVERSTIDLKFGGKTASRVDSGWRIQALVYGLARRVPVDFHATSWPGKAQTPRSHPGLRFDWDARQTVIASRTLRWVVDSILMHAARWPDGPWPGNLEHTWACNMCEFKPDCPWWTLTPADTL